MEFHRRFLRGDVVDFYEAGWFVNHQIFQKRKTCIGNSGSGMTINWPDTICQIPSKKSKMIRVFGFNLNLRSRMMVSWHFLAGTSWMYDDV